MAGSERQKELWLAVGSGPCELREPETEGEAAVRGRVGKWVASGTWPGASSLSDAEPCCLPPAGPWAALGFGRGGCDLS